jgi:CelD/BcsL family acetyltransferase involved in cellulose biosynthesis
MITVEEVTTRAGFEQLEPEWNALLARSASNNIVLTFEWLSTWWQVFGEGRELYILVARERDHIVGIAPLLRRTIRHYNLLPYERLEFLGSGEDEADEICSDYLDFMVQRGCEVPVLEALLRHIRQRGIGDELILTDVSGDSPCLQVLEGLCSRHELNLSITRDQFCHYLPLGDGWDKLLSSVEGRFRTYIRRDCKVFADARGELRIIDSSENFQENFTILIDLHQSRWNARGEPGVFASEKFRRFHRTLTPKLLRKGWVRLMIAFLAGSPISAVYTFVYNNKMYEYQNGLRTPDSPGGPTNVHSPGTLLQALSIKHSIESGLEEYDLLKTPPNSFKFKWRGRRRRILQIRVSQRSAKEAAYTKVTKVVDRLHQFKHLALQRHKLWLSDSSQLPSSAMR